MASWYGCRGLLQDTSRYSPGETEEQHETSTGPKVASSNPAEEDGF
jgi:hypothetical protein